ncbi:MAG: class I SAM-dependent DNA methyltransferase [Tagaea sp.]|nr:class I SAM-dependent DNA methyltransferase [Tagaea sp.]
MPRTDPAARDGRADAFIARWSVSDASERSNFQTFANELCDLLDVERPQTTGGDYRFERTVELRHNDETTSQGRIDLYKRGAFVLEAKQLDWRVRDTPAFTRRLLAAKGQAEAYAKALPADHGWPPFLIVVDVGGSFDLFADFSGIGKYYLPFPDQRSSRIPLARLAEPETRARLAKIWTDPLDLDPARHAAALTQAVARDLGDLARELEADGRAPDDVALFLMRALFTMFAQHVELLPKDSFVKLLDRAAKRPADFAAETTKLWRAMDKGGACAVLDGAKLRRFNGALFRDAQALPLDLEQIRLLRDAATKSWRDVEPTIFGTLLERALDPGERHKLGAHYTPRAYVERLVVPTVIEPLRRDWDDVKVAALARFEAGAADAAREILREFHRKLCDTKILDPSCGSGNFLYVALELMKRLEAEILDLLQQLGEDQYLLELSDHTVDPHQFLGLESNPRAVEIAQMVVWIGFLQWHFRGSARAEPPTPVLPEQRTIARMDAVLAWQSTRPKKDAAGKPVTRWDRKTFVVSPTTGRPVPDARAQVGDEEYLRPRIPDWPHADFIVGNPPFIGASHMRETLGDGYVEALRKVHREIPDSCDYVMYWWDKAARLTRARSARGFGFITTNSVCQTFNRRLVETHLRAGKPLALAFAIADHPWVDSWDGAAVRIAMTAGVPGHDEGKLGEVLAERPGDEGSRAVDLAFRTGRINPDLTVGVDVTRALPLRANAGLSSPGMKLHGAGFIVTPAEAAKLGLGRIKGLQRHIRPYRNGKDLTAHARGVLVIDLFGLTAEQVRERYPAVYQHLSNTVRKVRDAKRGDRDSDEYASKWWLFGKPRQELRPALYGLERYIATVETTKHRVFQFLDGAIMPDNMLVCVASDDAFVLGVLSSRIHVAYALARGGTLEDRPRYNKSVCFDPFPFPLASDRHRDNVRARAEKLDAHRKAVLAAHAELTLTGLYNVLEKLRTGEALSAKERATHDKGLVGVLRELHDELDEAVAAAYGWAADLAEAEILDRLVRLNAQRRADENAGAVRWLRPEYQTATQAERREMLFDWVDVEAAPEVPLGKLPWPSATPEQVAALRALFARETRPLDLKDIGRRFKGAKLDAMRGLVSILAALGHVTARGDRYIG